MSHITWFEPVWWWRLFPITCYHFFSSIWYLFIIFSSYCPCNFSTHPVTGYNNPTCSFIYLLFGIFIGNISCWRWDQYIILSSGTNYPMTLYDFFFMVQQPLVGQGLLIIKASRSHSNTPHSVRLLWMSGQPNAETCTWQHTTLIRHRHPCLWCDSNPQSQQVSGHRYTP